MKKGKDSCSGKTYCISFSDAIFYAKKLHKHRSVKSVPYKCNYCGNYHVGQSFGVVKKIIKKSRNIVINDLEY